MKIRTQFFKYNGPTCAHKNPILIVQLSELDMSFARDTTYASHKFVILAKSGPGNFANGWKGESLYATMAASGVKESANHRHNNE